MQIAYFDNGDMKQDDILTLTIADVGYAGEGIAHSDGYTVFVSFVLPEEEVLAKVNHVKGNLAYATLVEVKKASPHRVAPPCNRFAKCGGCDLMHADYAYQLELKRRQVATTLAKEGVSVKVKPCVPSPKQLGYRNKMSLPFGIVEGKVALGFYREGTHKLVRLTKCPLHEDWAEQIIKATIEFAETYDLSVYDSRTGKGLLRHLVARKMGEHVDITLVINWDKLPHWTEYVNALHRVWPDFCLYVSPNLRHNNVIMGDKIYLRWGIPYEHTVEGVKVSVNPLSFLQVNDEVCAAIYAKVREAVDPRVGRTVVDAFAGVGTLGASFAKSGADVYNIEIVPEAIEDADRLAEANGIAEHNICGDSARVLPTLLLDLTGGTPKVHEMGLQYPYMAAIAEGRKTYELRLLDEKRQKVAIGDVIRFESEGKALYCRVTDKLIYEDFAALFTALGTEKTCADLLPVDEAAESMTSIYSKEKQAKYAVVALGVEPVNAEGVTVVLDPPRKGCKEVAETLSKMDEEARGPKNALSNEAWETVKLPMVDRIVYVSCNPATLARDLATLQKSYCIEEVQPYDMFPQTRHVETVVCLSKQKSDGHIEICLN